MSGLRRLERAGRPYGRTPVCSNSGPTETLLLRACAPAPIARENRSHRRGLPLISSIGESPAESQKTLRTWLVD